MRTHDLIRLVAVLLLFTVGTWCLAAPEEEPPRLKEVDRLSPHRNRVESIAFSPDGKKLLSVEGIGTARIWELVGGQKTFVLQHTVPETIFDGWKFTKVSTRYPIRAAAFSPDSKRVATIGADHAIWLWDAANGKKITSFDVFAKDRPRGTALVFGSDGKTVSAIVRGKLWVWDVEKKRDKPGELVRELRVCTIDERPGRTNLHLVRASRSIKKPMIAFRNILVDAVTGERCYFNTNAEGGVVCAAISGDETKVATGGTGSVELWELPSDVRDGAAGTKRIATLRLPPVEVRCLAFGANGKILAAGYFDYRKDTLGRGGVLLFEVPSGKLLANHHERFNPVDSLAFSPDGRLLATEDKEGFIILWKVPDAWRKGK